MRASLDYLITALIRSTGREESGQSGFPIYGIDGRIHWTNIDAWWEQDEKQRVARQLRGTPPGTKDALKRLQPFLGAPRTNPRQHPLFALHTLSNRDKHRSLNLLALRAAIEFVDGGGNPLYDGPPMHAPVAQADQSDAFTATLQSRREGNVYLRTSYEVRMHEAPALFGDLVDTLIGINRYVDDNFFPTVARLLRSQAHAVA